MKWMRPHLQVVVYTGNFLPGCLELCPFEIVLKISFVYDCILNNYTWKIDQGHPPGGTVKCMQDLLLNVCKTFLKQKVRAKIKCTSAF